MIHKFYSSRGKKIDEPLFESIPPDSRASFHVFHMSEWSLPFAWHYHPEIEIDLYKEGEGLRFVGDSVENFQSGDLCLLGSNLPHSWTAKPSPKKRQRSIFIQFLPNCLGPGLLEKPEMQKIDRLLERSSLGLKFHGKTQRTVAERIVAFGKLPKGHWKRVTELISILGMLAESKECKTLSSPAYSPSRNLNADQRLNRVLNFVTADPNSIPSQETVARKVGMSPPSFSRFFKRCMGKNYVQFRNEIRVNRACQLLPDSSKSILDVAMHAGFENLSNFNEQFRKIKGMTPREYRRKWEAQ